MGVQGAKEKSLLGCLAGTGELGQNSQAAAAGVVMKIWGLIVVLVAALLATPALAGVKVVNKHLAAKNKDYDYTIDYPVTGVANIDRTIGAFVKEKVAEYGGAPEDGDARERPYWFELSYEVARNDGKVFAVLFAESSDTGGAHPNSDFTSFDFLMPDGAQVFLPEIVDGKRGLARVSAYAVKDLTTQLAGPDGMSDTDWIAKGASPLATNLDIFLLLPDKIAIHFPAYQVAAYAAGPQEVDVPLSYLKGYLRKDPRAPQASFDCATAASAIEHAICGDAMLARLDRQAAEQYADDLVNAFDKGKEQKWRQTQRDWVAARDKQCSMPAPAECLRKSYTARLELLKKYSPE